MALLVAWTCVRLCRDHRDDDVSPAGHPGRLGRNHRSSTRAAPLPDACAGARRGDLSRSFPIFDLSWVGQPPEVRLGLLLIPVMTAVIITNRFRGFGASAAILTTT